ncbi:MAG: DUF4384 domain-containing protein [Hyphomicrobiaceae bacterium]
MRGEVVLRRSYIGFPLAAAVAVVVIVSGAATSLARDGRENTAVAAPPATSASPGPQSGVDAPSPLARAMAAGAVLERHCARCHDAAEVAPGSQPSGLLGNILSLDDLAQNPHLVRPGEPDASLLYQVMVGQQMPPQLRAPSSAVVAPATSVPATAPPVTLSGPDVADLAAIRHWIAGLPSRTAACAAAPPVTAADVQAAAKLAVAALPADIAADMAFVSLAGLRNRCASDPEIDAVRLALSGVLERLAVNSEPVAVVPVAGHPLLLAFRLSHLGWSAEIWGRIASRLPASARRGRSPGDEQAPLPPVAWLAAVLRDAATAGRSLGVPPRSEKPASVATISNADEQAKLASSPSQPTSRQTPPAIDGLDPAEGLARRWTRDLDIVDAAADLGTTVEDLVRLLDGLASDPEGIAARLRFGVVTRAEFETLAVMLAGADSGTNGSAGDAAAASPSPQALRVDLWPVEARYRVGDGIALKVRASAACHVTLINIDTSGEATVLFPNEFDRDNLLSAGSIRTIPDSEATYRFRFDHAGTERFVAICEVGEPVPAGIRPEFTKQNFTPLGRWDAFVAAAHRAAGEARVPLDYGDDPDRQFRRGRRGVVAGAPRAAPDGAPLQGRSAIRVEIAR